MDTNNLIYQIKDIIWNKKNTIEKYKGSKFSLQLQREINILEIAIDTINNMPLSKTLQKENEEISTQYKILSKKLDHALEVMDIIQERDNNFYRVMLEADSIPYVLRTGNYDATARYDKWDDYRTA